MPQSSRPGAGDFTGQEKRRQQREQAQVQQERAAEMSMASAEQDEEERNATFDGQSGEMVDPGHVAYSVEEDGEDRRPRFGGPQFPEEPVLTGQESPEALDAVLATRTAVLERPRDYGTVQSAVVTVRISEDVEDMTWGMRNGEPNNYTFKEGLKYKVPRELAIHLDQRGLVREWVSR